MRVYTCVHCCELNTGVFNSKHSLNSIFLLNINKLRMVIKTFDPNEKEEVERHQKNIHMHGFRAYNFISLHFFYEGK